MSNTKTIYAIRVEVGDAIVRPKDEEILHQNKLVYEITRETPKTMIGYNETRDWSRKFRKDHLDVINPSAVEGQENTVFSFFTDEEEKIETLVLKGLALAAVQSREQLKKAEGELADLEKAIHTVLNAE